VNIAKRRTAEHGIEYNSIMSKIRIQDIRRDPSDFLRRVEEGETLLVLRDDEPLAEVRPVSKLNGQPRPFGLCAGQFTVPTDFDAPLPESMLKEFEGT
jgi:antitoxin (DNA-binding transcriptional repressor) of toxin-antitoxin stability system